MGDPLDIGGDLASDRPGRPIGVWIELLVAVALAVALALVAVGLVVAAVDPALRRGTTTRVVEVVGAVVCLGLAVACSRWAMHVEHRLRGDQPAAQTFAAASGSAAAPARWGRGRPDRYSPVTGAAFMAAFIAATAGFAVASISSYSQAARSSYTQHHGIPAIATVDSVANDQQCPQGRNCYYTAAVTVTLRAPVGGTRATVAHDRGYANLSRGEQVSVLVDPEQPGYAEFPGSTFELAWPWILFAAAAVFFGGLAIADGLDLRRVRAHGREFGP